MKVIQNMKVGKILLKKRFLVISIFINLLLFVALVVVAYKTNVISVLLNRNTDKNFNPQYEQRLTLFEKVKTNNQM
jgi:O-antigen ligase